MPINTLSTELFEEISKIPCINSHSHIIPEVQRLKESPDALAFFKHAYAESDLVSAGMDANERQMALTPQLPLAQRLDIVK